MEKQKPTPVAKQAEAEEDQSAVRNEKKRLRTLDPEYVCSTPQDLIDLLGALDALKDPS